MKYKYKIFQVIRKCFLWIYFIINPVKCSRFMGVKIGENCKIYGNSPNMWGTEPFLITIGNNVYITDGCKFINHDGGTLILRKRTPSLEFTAPISIGNDVYLGIETLIMPGVKMGNNIIVGARSVITKNVDDNSVMVGVPAKLIKSVDEYYESIKSKSLALGHLNRDQKEKELKKLFNRI